MEDKAKNIHGIFRGATDGGVSEEHPRKYCQDKVRLRVQVWCLARGHALGHRFIVTGESWTWANF